MDNEHLFKLWKCAVREHHNRGTRQESLLVLAPGGSKFNDLSASCFPLKICLKDNGVPCPFGRLIMLEDLNSFVTLFGSHERSFKSSSWRPEQTFGHVSLLT